MPTDARLPAFWQAEVPGERLEGRWTGLEEDGRGRATGRMQTADGELRVPLTSVLEARARRLEPGAPIRITYRGFAYTQAGRPYRRLEIEPLLEDELPDRPPTRPVLRPGEQGTLW